MSPSTLLHDEEVATDRSLTAELDVSVELDAAMAEPPTRVAPVVIPPRAQPAAPPEPEAEAISPQRRRVLDHLMRMADQYLRGGSLRQAIELYFELVNDHAGTDQAERASDRLLQIAQQYEDNGELRQARGLYERLLKAS